MKTKIILIGALLTLLCIDSAQGMDHGEGEPGVAPTLNTQYTGRRGDEREQQLDPVREVFGKAYNWLAQPESCDKLIGLGGLVWKAHQGNLPSCEELISKAAPLVGERAKPLLPFVIKFFESNSGSAATQEGADFLAFRHISEYAVTAKELIERIGTEVGFRIGYCFAGGPGAMLGLVVCYLGTSASMKKLPLEHYLVDLAQYSKTNQLHEIWNDLDPVKFVNWDTVSNLLENTKAAKTLRAQQRKHGQRFLHQIAQLDTQILTLEQELENIKREASSENKVEGKKALKKNLKAFEEKRLSVILDAIPHILAAISHGYFTRKEMITLVARCLPGNLQNRYSNSLELAEDLLKKAEDSTEWVSVSSESQTHESKSTTIKYKHKPIVMIGTVLVCEAGLHAMRNNWGGSLDDNYGDFLGEYAGYLPGVAIIALGNWTLTKANPETLALNTAKGVVWTCSMIAHAVRAMTGCCSKTGKDKKA